MQQPAHLLSQQKHAHKQTYGVLRLWFDVSKGLSPCLTSMVCFRVLMSELSASTSWVTCSLRCAVACVACRALLRSTSASAYTWQHTEPQRYEVRRKACWWIQGSFTVKKSSA
jgi:hypothetical protein